MRLRTLRRDGIRDIDSRFERVRMGDEHAGRENVRLDRRQLEVADS